MVHFYDTFIQLFVIFLELDSHFSPLNAIEWKTAASAFLLTFPFASHIRKSHVHLEKKYNNNHNNNYYFISSIYNKYIFLGRKCEHITILIAY